MTLSEKARGTGSSENRLFGYSIAAVDGHNPPGEKREGKVGEGERGRRGEVVGVMHAKGNKGVSPFQG